MSRRRHRGERGGSRRKPSLLQRILRNRYNPQSPYVTLGDAIANIKAIFFCWSERVPPGSRLLYRNGKIVGWSAPWRGKL